MHRQLGDGAVAPDCRHRHLRLERRAVLLPCPLHVLLPRYPRFLGAGLHLSHLSHFRGPAQRAASRKWAWTLDTEATGDLRCPRDNPLTKPSSCEDCSAFTHVAACTLIRALEGLEPSRSGRCPAHTTQPSDSSRLPQQLRLLDFLSGPGIALATAGGARSPRFRRDPFIRGVALDPGRAAVPCIAAPHMLPSAVATASAPATSRISWLNPTPQMITVYASSWSSPSPTQHSLPSRRYPLPGPDFHRLDRASFAWRTATPSHCAPPAMRNSIGSAS